MNKFKVGDWVHCYALAPQINGFVRYAIRVEIITWKRQLLWMSNGVSTDMVPAHYKMCRKLKKPPLKSYVQHLNTDGTWTEKKYTKENHS
jgi:hypothetical protein